MNSRQRRRSNTRTAQYRDAVTDHRYKKAHKSLQHLQPLERVKEARKVATFLM
jgi:hypothetical protein